MINPLKQKYDGKTIKKTTKAIPNIKAIKLSQTFFKKKERREKALDRIPAKRIVKNNSSYALAKERTKSRTIARTVNDNSIMYFLSNIFFISFTP